MFCKYCGNQVPDGEVCSCAESTAARAAAAAPVATAEPTPAAAPAAPAAGNDIGKITGDAFKSIPGAIRTLLNNTEGSGMALPTTVVLAVGGLLLNILAWVCMVGGILGGLEDAVGGMAWAYISKVFKGIYGFGILGALWTCIIPIALSMAIILVGQLIRKEKIDIIPAFTTGTCVNILPSVIFLVGALISMLIPVIGILLILVGIVAGLAADYKLLSKIVPNTNGVIGGLIAAAVVAVVFGLMAWIVSGVLTGYVEGPLAENIATILGGSIGDIGDLLGEILGGF